MDDETSNDRYVNVVGRSYGKTVVITRSCQFQNILCTKHGVRTILVPHIKLLVMGELLETEFFRLPTLRLTFPGRSPLVVENLVLSEGSNIKSFEFTTCQRSPVKTEVPPWVRVRSTTLTPFNSDKESTCPKFGINM